MIERINGFGAIGGHDSQRRQMGEKLMSLGIPENIVKQGPSAVEAYASANGIELPQKPQRQEATLFSNLNKIDQQQIGNKSVFGGGKEAFEAQLIALGIPLTVIAQGKNAVESYAEKNDITLPTPPQKPSRG